MPTAAMRLLVGFSPLLRLTTLVAGEGLTIGTPLPSTEPTRISALVGFAAARPV